MSRSNSLWGFLSRKVEKQKKSPAVHTLGLASLSQNHTKFKKSCSPKLLYCEIKPPARVAQFARSL